MDNCDGCASPCEAEDERIPTCPCIECIVKVMCETACHPWITWYLNEEDY
jgi:hypothetical protein